MATALVGEVLRACRVCLATDVELVTFGYGRLADNYLELTGITVSPTDGLPHHLCSMCVALLRKSTAFKKKCHSTHEFLQRVRKRLNPLGRPLDKFHFTVSLLHNLDRKHFKLPYITTNTSTVNIPGDTDHIANIINNELPVKTEIQLEFKENSDEDCVLTEDGGTTNLEEETIDILKDENIFTDLINEETKLKVDKAEQSKKEQIIPIWIVTKEQNLLNDSITDERMLKEEAVEPIKKYILGNSNISKKPRAAKSVVSKKRKHNILEKNQEKIKVYLSKSAEETKDSFKTVLYKHVLDKYFYKTKESRNKETPDNFIDKCVISAAEKSFIIANFNDKRDLTENDNVTPGVFYKYIGDKYVNELSTKGKKKETDAGIKRRRQNWKSKSKEEIDEITNAYNFDVVRVMTKKEQILHMEQARKNSHLSRKLRCQLCFRGFASMAVFQKHQAVHDPSSGSHACEVCKQHFRTQRQLSDHTRRHSIKFVCRQCRQEFQTWSLAQEHHKFHEGVQFECKQCGATFKQHKSRIEHMRLHHGAAVCGICYRGFQGSKGLVVHKTLAHKQIFECESCAVQFDSARAITRHMGAAPGGACDPNMRACAKCGERCGSDERLGEHIARLHCTSKQKKLENQKKPQKPLNETPRPRLFRKCCTCPQRNNGGAEGNVPNNDHNIPTDDFCPCVYGVDDCVCPKGSMRSCELPKRNCSSNGTEKFQNRWRHRGCCGERRQKKTKVMCEMCGLLCNSPAALRSHQTVHTGEKPHQCPECPKRFSMEVNLRAHQRTHSGLRPYKCAYCPKTFTNRPNTFRHHLVHTQVRRFTCGVCPKAFKTTGEVKQHVRSVHMKVPQKPRARTRRKNGANDINE